MSTPRPRCPHCDAAEVESIGAWGGQLITSQMRCRRCNSYFEALRDAVEPGAERPTGPGDR